MGDTGLLQFISGCEPHSGIIYPWMCFITMYRLNNGEMTLKVYEQIACVKCKCNSFAKGVALLNSHSSVILFT